MINANFLLGVICGALLMSAVFMGVPRTPIVKEPEQVWRRP